MACLRPASLLKMSLRRRCFPVIFAIFLRTHVLQNICKQLLLIVILLFYHFIKNYFFLRINFYWDFKLQFLIFNNPKYYLFHPVLNCLIFESRGFIIGIISEKHEKIFSLHLMLQSSRRGLRPATFVKKRLRHRYFPVNFAKFLRTVFFIEHPWWLLLSLYISLKQHKISGFLLIFSRDAKRNQRHEVCYKPRNFLKISNI